MAGTKSTFTSTPERRFVERARHSEKGVNIDEALANVQVLTVTNISGLTDEQCNNLKAGNVVLKQDNTGLHTYICSYKKDNVGLCLTYNDAEYTETISYDYTGDHWVYNSKDSTVIASKDYVDSLLSGALKREIVETLPTEDIDTNTIYMVLDDTASSGNVYNEYLYINNAWELIGTTAVDIPKKYKHYCFFDLSGQTVCIEIENNSSADLTGDDIVAFIQSLPTNALYPISQVGLNAYYGTTIIFITAVKNDRTGAGGQAKFAYMHSTLKISLDANNKLQFGNSNDNTVMVSPTITSQYAIEV